MHLLERPCNVSREGIGLIILDECHHLVGHRGRVLANAFEFLDRPVVLGLTATPPEESGKIAQIWRGISDFWAD